MRHIMKSRHHGMVAVAVHVGETRERTGSTQGSSHVRHVEAELRRKHIL